DDEAGQGVLAKWRVHHAVFAEFVHEFGGRSENSFWVGHAEADQENIGVALQTNRRRVANRFGVSHVTRFAHGANTPRCNVAGSGFSLARTFSMMESIS